MNNILKRNLQFSSDDVRFLGRTFGQSFKDTSKRAQLISYLENSQGCILDVRNKPYLSYIENGERTEREHVLEYWEVLKEGYENSIMLDLRNKNDIFLNAMCEEKVDMAIVRDMIKRSICGQNLYLYNHKQHTTSEHFKSDMKMLIKNGVILKPCWKHKQGTMEVHWIGTLIL